jgi:hypothetical protein
MTSLGKQEEYLKECLKVSAWAASAMELEGLMPPVA